MIRLRPDVAGLCLAVAASRVGAATGAPRPLPANPRDLPSLAQRWTWRGKADADSVALEEGIAYVRNGGRLTAIAAGTGRVLWETVCAEDDDPRGQGPVVAGDALAVSFGKQLLLVDRRTGQVRRQVPVGQVFRITGPPLLVVAEGQNERTDLLSVDPSTGDVVARREVGGVVYDVKASDDVAVAIVGQVSSEDDEILAGYTTDTLRELWRLPFRGFPDLSEIAGGLYAGVLEGEGDEAIEEFRLVNPTSGGLGPALPQRLASNVSGGLTWELEVVELHEGRTPARLRRNSFETGRPVWSVELPDSPTAWVRARDSLYLHCDHERGRGYLIVLDWASGALAQAAYGLRDVRGLFSFGDTIVAWTEAGLTSFSAIQFGPPERPDLRSEVEAILASVTPKSFSMQDQIRAAVTDLKALGPRALPFVTGCIPLAPPPAMVAAARVVAAAGFKGAAMPLAARLADPPPPALSEFDRWDPAVDVLQALAKIGEAGQVPAIVAVLDDEAREGWTRFQAFMALANIGTPPALQAIERVLAQPPRAESWWHPASPEDFLEYVGRPNLKQLEDEAGQRADWTAVHKMEMAAHTLRVPLAEGGMLVVFHDTRLGGSKDLWVAEVDAMGRILGPGDFLGGDAGEPLRASVEGGTLTIERTSPPGSVQFELAELRRDTDGDGLPDVVERRIRTDPSLQDTDGDGLIDSKDSAPNGAALPASEEQDIVRAVFQQYFTFKDAADHDLAVMVSEFPLQWLGRQGPTITLTPRQDSEFIEEAGLDGIAHISIAPGWHERGRDEDPDQELAVAADERRYRLTSYRGGLNAVGYDITVRRLGRRWLIKECTMAWIS